MSGRNLIMLLFVSMAFSSCMKIEWEEKDPEDMTNEELMHSLNISDASIWNTLATQSISIEDSEDGDNLKSTQSMQEYPKNGNYYFALFEDLYPSEGDYDFNDVMLKSILGLEKKGQTVTGYLNTTLINRGGSKPVKIGLMFYTVSGKRYTRIDFSKIKVNDMQLSDKPWTTPLSELGKEWKINFEFESNSNNLWISYYIETNDEIMTGGFAPSNVESFETPHPHYLSPYSLPWGMEIESKSFAIPNEKELFLKAYPDFEDWARSNGIKNKNWFENPNSEYTHN